MDRLKGVSRQSIVVLTNYLLMMNNLNNVNLINDNRDNSIICIDNSGKNDVNQSYDMAFEFTSDIQKNENILTDNGHDIVDESDLNNIENNQFYNNNKEIIINNTFAVASKDVKNDLQKKFVALNDYLTDKKYMVAAGTLIDTKIEVAGDGYIILSCNNEAIVDKVYNNYKLSKELINKLFDSDFNFVIITSDEWIKLRDNYILNVKNGIKYHIKELIQQNSLIDDDVIKKEPTVVDKLFNLVGEDVVEFK